MELKSAETPRQRAQELMWDAMDLLGRDNERAEGLCRQALEIYPDCVDARVMIADLECQFVRDHVAALREAVEAGRRDLGPEYFERERGHFWALIETRPFMRAMAMLARSLMEWGTTECVEEAIVIQEEMLELNPGDNQGVRDILVGCYLQRKRYDDAADLLERYGEERAAIPCWSRVLLAYATGAGEQARALLDEAREQNPHVELYLTGRKRLPRTRSWCYSPGDASEAVFCADAVGPAWKKHPKTKRWLKEIVEG